MPTSKNQLQLAVKNFDEDVSTFGFPCISGQLPLRSIQFSGPLIPDCWFNDIRLEMKQWAKTNIKNFYTCWCCEKKNIIDVLEKQFQRCKHCSRPRFPSWTIAADNFPIFVGDVILVGKEENDESKTDMKNESQRKAFVTLIDYRKCCFELVEEYDETDLSVMKGIRKSNNQELPEQVSIKAEIPHSTVKRTKKSNLTIRTVKRTRLTAQELQEDNIKIQVVKYATTNNNSHDKTDKNTVKTAPALSFRKIFLCGKCGKLGVTTPCSSNNLQPRLFKESEIQQDVLNTPLEQENFKGKLRTAEKSLIAIEKEVTYLKRRWTERKNGYADYMKAEAKRKELLEIIHNLKKALEPLQLWCAYCEWEWPGGLEKLKKRFTELQSQHVVHLSS